MAQLERSRQEKENVVTTWARRNAPIMPGLQSLNHTRATRKIHSVHCMGKDVPNGSTGASRGTVQNKL